MRRLAQPLGDLRSDGASEHVPGRLARQAGQPHRLDAGCFEGALLASRAAASSATRSASSLLVANNKASCAERSSQCASSRTTHSGSASAAAASRLSVAAPIAKRSCASPGPRPSAGAQGVGLMLGDLSEMTPQRPADLEQRGELELRLGLDSEGAYDRHSLGPLHRVAQERGLPDARVAADRQRPAAPRPRTVEQLVQPPARALTADQRAPTLTPEDDRR